MKRAKMKVVSFESADVIATSGDPTTCACVDQHAHWVKNEHQDGTAFNYVNGTFVNINDSSYSHSGLGTDYYYVSSYDNFGSGSIANIPVGTWYVGNAATFEESTSWDVCTHTHTN